MKRIGSLLLAVVMTFSMPITVSARTYADAGVDDYSTEYRDAINFVADNGYMIGTSDTTFVPEGLMTRAMLVTVLYSMNNAGKKDSDIKKYTGESLFTDVKQGDWFFDAVCWANENGLVAGNGMGQFSPHSYLLKQDAVLILYQYARQKVAGTDALAAGLDESILSGYADASNVSGYALQAVRWAVDRQIFPAESETVLNPKGRLTRAQMALLITQYGLNVEHIVQGRDNYRFLNDGSIFSSGPYYITDDMFSKLERGIEVYYGETPIKDRELEKIRRERYQYGGGSCYGMAVTTILDKMGKIDMNGNFATNAKTMHSKGMEQGSALESALNYYVIAEEIAFVRNSQRYNEKETVVEQLPLMVEDCLDYQGLILFSYWWDIGYGHTIIAYDMVQKGDKVYELSGYDYRTTDPITIMLTVDGENSSCLVTDGSTTVNATRVEVVTDFSAFDYIDIDAETNELPKPSAADLQAEVDSTILEVQLTTDFTITNEAGQQLIYCNGRCSGDMKVYNAFATTNGPEMPSELILYVEPSESFIFEPVSAESEITMSVNSNVGYATISGVNVECVAIEADNRMYPAGKDVEYEIIYDDNNKEWLEIVTSNDVE